MTNATTSRAVYYDQFGGPEVLKIGEIPLPPVGPDSVVVKVAGTGINPVDYKIAMGYLDGYIELRFPVVIGWDVAGEVTAVGRAWHRCRNCRAASSGPGEGPHKHRTRTCSRRPPNWIDGTSAHPTA